MDETWCTDVSSQEVIKKVIKSWGHSARFHVTMLTNTAIWDPSGPRATQNEAKRRDFFDDACAIAQNLTWMYCLSTYVPEKNAF